MSLTAYFDDSGGDAGNSCLVVAGFASTVEKWGKFESVWESALRDFDDTHFHAKEFDDARRGFGRYSNWPKSKRSAYMKRLLEAIINGTEKSFAIVLEKQGFEAVTNLSHVRKRFFGSMYGTSSFITIQRTSRWRDEAYPGIPILFCFDQGHANEGELLREGETLRKSDKLIADIKTGDDKKSPPLQAADLLAFELCSDVRRSERKQQRHSRFPLRLLGDFPHDWIMATRTQLEELLNPNTAI